MAEGGRRIIDESVVYTGDYGEETQEYDLRDIEESLGPENDAWGAEWQVRLCYVMYVNKCEPM